MWETHTEGKDSKDQSSRLPSLIFPPLPCFLLFCKKMAGCNGNPWRHSGWLKKNIMLMEEEKKQKQKTTTFPCGWKCCRQKNRSHVSHIHSHLVHNHSSSQALQLFLWYRREISMSLAVPSLTLAHIDIASRGWYSVVYCFKPFLVISTTAEFCPLTRWQSLWRYNYSSVCFSEFTLDIWVLLSF